VRVGRKLMVSADQTEVQVTFVIEEGVRYKIDKVVFNGVAAVKESELRADLKLQEGNFYDGEVVQRDIRAIVKAYSPYGYVYQAPPAAKNPEYLWVDARDPVFHKEAGKLDLIYDIHEGKPFHMGRVLVKGNSKTQDKVVLREMHVAPGQLYNSAEINDAVDRLRGLGYFGTVNVTPVGEEPESRDVLVEVAEGRTASFNIGAGVSSNGGLGGEISYEQRNYDIGKWPATWGDMFAEHAFTGAGQTFRAAIAPSTVGTSASIRFTDPYLLDQPYSFSDELYYRQRARDVYEETRAGTRASLGKRLSRRWLLSLGGRLEDVKIDNLEDPIDQRPFEIREFEGHTTVTGLGPTLRYDSTNRGPLLYRGLVAQAGYERVGGLGGDVTFNKYTASLDSYYTLIEDLFDRKTVLSLHGDAGYIDDSNAPMFERFYAGGLGSVRGFKYRGISPRVSPSKVLVEQPDGSFKPIFDPLGHDVEDPQGDAVGGAFSLTTSAEVSYPIYADMLRGVFFIDGGTVEPDVKIGTYRVAVGFGFRIILPFAQGAPLALDFGFPIKSASGDDKQLISFSFGMSY
jgi:outer membrane protein insertion porin family